MNLLNKCYDCFSSFIEDTTMSYLYFNEENDYSEKNTNDNEVFRSTILQPFQFEPELKIACGNERHEKETKHTHASADDLLHIRIGNLDCKCRYCKNEAREIDCLFCREVDAMLIGLTKISELKGSILPFSFHGQLPDY